MHRNGVELIERKTLRKSSTTHPPYQRESYSFLEEKFLQSLLLSCPLLYPIKRRFVSKYYPHPFKVLRGVFGVWEALEDAKDGGCNMELIAGSGKLEKTQLGLTLLEQEVWKAQVHWVDQAWRVYCYSCIPTLFSSGSFHRLEGSEEVFP